MKKLIWFLFLLSFTHLKAQKIDVTPYVSIGNYTTFDYGNGRSYLGLEAAYRLSESWSLGLDVGAGGNLLFGDQTLLDNTATLEINSRSAKFSFYGWSQQNNLLHFLYILLQAKTDMPPCPPVSLPHCFTNPF